MILKLIKDNGLLEPGQGSSIQSLRVLPTLKLGLHANENGPEILPDTSCAK